MASGQPYPATAFRRCHRNEDTVRSTDKTRRRALANPAASKAATIAERGRTPSIDAHRFRPAANPSGTSATTPCRVHPCND